VGRLPGCALALEHPSVSRHHAVLQYRGAGRSPDGPDAAGFYVYDLGSTHGTFLNKARVPPRTYCRVRVGHGLRFGGSSRLFLLQVRPRFPRRRLTRLPGPVRVSPASRGVRASGLRGGLGARQPSALVVVLLGKSSQVWCPLLWGEVWGGGVPPGRVRRAQGSSAEGLA